MTSDYSRSEIMADGNVNNYCANVIFHDIEDVISVDQYLTCRYTLSDNVGQNTRDWIGLYKVGWRSSSDYMTYEWAATPGNYTVQGNTNNVVISFHVDSTVLENENDFYQFCYVDSKDKIQGTSRPFRIKFDDDFVEIEEEEDGEIVVIKSKTSFLEEIKREKIDSQRKASKLESERDELLMKVKLLEEELNQMTQERNVERKEKEEIAKVLEKITESRKNEEDVRTTSGRRHRRQAHHSADSVRYETRDESVDYKQNRGCRCMRSNKSKSYPSSEELKLQEKNCIANVEEDKQMGELQIAARSTAKAKLFNPIWWPSSKMTGSATDNEVGLNMFCLLKENMDPFSTDSYFDEMEYMTVNVDSSVDGKSRKFSTNVSPTTQSNDTFFRWALIEDDEEVGAGKAKRKEHSVHQRKTTECSYWPNVLDVDSGEEEFHDRISMHADYFNLSAML